MLLAASSSPAMRSFRWPPEPCALRPQPYRKAFGQKFGDFVGLCGWKSYLKKIVSKIEEQEKLLKQPGCAESLESQEALCSQARRKSKGLCEEKKEQSFGNALATRFAI